MATYTAAADTTLSFEHGPSDSIQLQWATYYDAADQAGLSRLWGGIHMPVDDVTGRQVGSQCGQGAWLLARRYFDGSLLSAPADLNLQRSGTSTVELRCPAIRGVFYKLQSTASLLQPFVDAAGGYVQATESEMNLTDEPVGSQKYYRVVGALSP
jgi:hypothetical protein